MTRKEVYLKWKEAKELLLFAEAENRRLTKLGDDIFAKKYNNSFKNYDEVNGDPELDDPWNLADVELEKIEKNKLFIEKYYNKLLELTFTDWLSEYESCGNFKKLIQIKFFDGKEKVGYIYPWEGDYAGPPYYLTDEENADEYINYGEFIEQVELLEVKCC